MAEPNAVLPADLVAYIRSYAYPQRFSISIKAQEGHQMIGRCRELAWREIQIYVRANQVMAAKHINKSQAYYK